MPLRGVPTTAGPGPCPGCFGGHLIHNGGVDLEPTPAAGLPSFKPLGDVATAGAEAPVVGTDPAAAAAAAPASAAAKAADADGHG